ncbi:MAG: hypothetical protein LBI01_06035 [Elusimicrobium sp.]|jgi:hypothetical protein|nr:hypothetical protein [Elusimicrobium sp.]
MKKLFAAAALLLPCLGFAQIWPPSAAVFSSPLYAQQDLGLILRPVTASVNFNNVTPCDTAEMFVVPAGTAINDADGMPAQYNYRGNVLDMETCNGNSCATYYNTQITWDGKGDVKPVSAGGSYPTGFEKLLPAGKYDVVWRFVRAEGCGGIGVKGVPAGSFEIRNIDGMAAGTDDSVVEMKNNGTVFIDPSQAVFDDAGNSKIHIKLNGGVTNAAVFIGGAGNDLKDSLAAVAAGATAKINGVSITLDALKNGVEITPPAYINQSSLPVFYNNPMLLNRMAYYDDCLYAYVLKEGTFTVTVVYMIGENVYYKTAAYNVKYSLDTAIKQVAKQTAQMTVVNGRVTPVDQSAGVKTIKISGLDGRTAGNNVNISGLGRGVYIAVGTLTNNQKFVFKFEK